MNYAKHYRLLIDRSPRIKPKTGYYERHHIDHLNTLNSDPAFLAGLSERNRVRVSCLTCHQETSVPALSRHHKHIG